MKKVIKKFYIEGKVRVGNTMSKFKLVLFDMDGTLLKDRGIFVIAEKKGFLNELIRHIKDSNMEYYERSIEIAKLSKGYSREEFLEIFREVPFNNNVEFVIRELNKRGFKTAIATDSYQFLADDVKNRLGIDYAFANKLKSDGDIITGELEIHNKNLTKDFNGENIYSICKSCVLEQLCKDHGITVEEAIAVGDGIVDIGMIKKAGLGVAINASDKVNVHADVVTDDMGILLDYI